MIHFRTREFTSASRTVASLLVCGLQRRVITRERLSLNQQRLLRPRTHGGGDMHESDGSHFLSAAVKCRLLASLCFCVFPCLFVATLLGSRLLWLRTASVLDEAVAHIPDG